MNSTTKRRVLAATIAGILAFGSAGCSGGAASSGDPSGGKDKTVTLGVVSGWNDMTDVANLYKYVLDKNGYTVNIKELSEIATMYVAGARGDVDAFSGSPTTIHKAYWDKYKDDMEIVGSYYDAASIYLAVPDYVTEIKSLEDLPAHAEELDGKIIGIEPGSGIVAATQNEAFPKYGLDGAFELQTSSTAAMNAALKDAVDAKKPIAVTAWNPYWLNSTFDLRKLEDPKKAYGDPYTLDIVARKGFSNEKPEVARMISEFLMTEDQFNTLDEAVYQSFKPGQEQQAVAAWLEKNPDVLKQLESSLKG